MLNRILSVLGLAHSARSMLRRFERDRDNFQSAYFSTAAATGIPRGLRWIRCEWPSAPPVLMKDRTTGEHSLLVSVNLSFEAIEGGDMEDVAAVSTVRDATAVFMWKQSRWVPSGRTLFNLCPSDAADRLSTSHAVVPS